MSLPANTLAFLSQPPGPALKVEDAGAREAWATMEQLLLVVDAFINDVNQLDHHTLELSTHGGGPGHELATNENVQETAPGRGPACE